MNDGSDSIRISLRQADGRHFPLFRRGDPDTRNLSLIPAGEEQSEADIQLFFHPTDGSDPVVLGILKFPDLPSGGENTELQLDAAIDPAGSLSVTVRHAESGRIVRLEVKLPDADEADEVSNRTVAAGNRTRITTILWGFVFVIAVLALVYYLTMRVTGWGRQDAPPPPVSRTESESSPA